MIIKPGYRTSEFWFTLVSFIFSGLYLVGVLKENEQKEELIEIVSHAVESTILIGGQALILYKYIKGRSEVKKVATKREVEVDIVETKQPTKTKKSTAKSKTNSKSKKKPPEKSHDK